MEGIRKAANKYSGLARCNDCKFFKNCSYEQQVACYKVSVKAFNAGVKWAEKKLKDK